MQFKEPLFDQPIRLIADDHICKNVDDLSLWLGIPIEECQDSLTKYNGKQHMTIRGYAYEPVDPLRPHKKRHRVEIEEIATGAISIYDSIYEAAVKMDIPERDLRLAMRGEGPWCMNYRVRKL